MSHSWKRNYPNSAYSRMEVAFWLRGGPGRTSEPFRPYVVGEAVDPHTQTCSVVHTWPMGDDFPSPLLDTIRILKHPQKPPLPWKGQDKGLTTLNVVTVILFASLFAIGSLCLVQAGE